jgi:hypothetical protein
VRAGRLAADRIETRNDDRVGRVVDHDVDPGSQLEGPDVSPFAPDDAPLHLVVRERHRRDRDPRVLRRNALHGSAIFLASLGVLLGRLRESPVAGWPRRLRPRARDARSIGLGFGRRHSRQRFESPTLIGDELVQLRLAFGDRLLLPPEVAGAPPEVAFALIEQVDLLLELRLAIVDATLLALHFLATMARFDFPRLAQLDQLFLTGEDRALARRLGFTLGVADDALGQFLRGALRGALCRAGALADRRPKNKNAAEATTQSTQAQRRESSNSCPSMLHRGSEPRSRRNRGRGAWSSI